MPNSRKSKSRHSARKSRSQKSIRTKKSHQKSSRKAHSKQHSRKSNKSRKSHKSNNDKANPKLWKKSVERALGKFNNKYSTHMYQHAVQLYKSEGGKFKNHKSPTDDLLKWQRGSKEYKDEPKSLKSKVNRILKDDSGGRMRMLRKFA